MADAKEMLRVREECGDGQIWNMAAQQLAALVKEEWYSESSLDAIRKRMSSAEFKQAQTDSQVERSEVYKRNYDDA